MSLYHSRVLLAVLAAALLTLGGCDLFGGDEVIRASGTVVLAETGEPLEGLNVELESSSGGIGGRSTELIVPTDAEGRFAFSFDAGGYFTNRVYRVFVYDDPFEPQYIRFYEIVHPGETRDFGVIELERIGD